MKGLLAFRSYPSDHIPLKDYVELLEGGKRSNVPKSLVSQDRVCLSLRDDWITGDLPNLNRRNIPSQ